MATIELDKSDTWNPPKEWVYGQCQDCGKRFMPKLPKQYYCYGCRVFIRNPDNETIRAVQAEALISIKPRQRPPARMGLIREVMNEQGIYTYPALARMVKGITPETLSRWNRGFCPARLEGPLRLAKALNTTLNKLFHPDIVAFLRNLHYDVLELEGETQ